MAYTKFFLGGPGPHLIVISRDPPEQRTQAPTNESQMTQRNLSYSDEKK